MRSSKSVLSIRGDAAYFCLGRVSLLEKACFRQTRQCGAHMMKPVALAQTVSRVCGSFRMMAQLGLVRVGVPVSGTMTCPCLPMTLYHVSRPTLSHKSSLSGYAPPRFRTVGQLTRTHAAMVSATVPYRKSDQLDRGGAVSTLASASAHAGP
jgi:hypothetical protein